MRNITDQSKETLRHLDKEVGLTHCPLNTGDLQRDLHFNLNHHIGTRNIAVSAHSPHQVEAESLERGNRMKDSSSLVCSWGLEDGRVDVGP